MRISDWSSDVCSSDLHLPDVIPGMLSEIVWTGDDSGFLYGLANAQWRTDNARLHRLGTDPVEDVELYREADEGYRVGVSETQSRRWIIIATGDHEIGRASCRARVCQYV